MGARVVVSMLLAWIAGCPASHGEGPYRCDPNPCDDGDPCNGTEICDPTVGCLAAPPIDCDDFDPCSRDTCEEGACLHEPTDRDGDGHADACAGGDDCGAMDPRVHPGADEICNGLDDDCDGLVDEGQEVWVLEERAIDVDPALGWSGPEVLLDDGRAVGWMARGVYAIGPDGSDEVIDLDILDPSLRPLVVGATRVAVVHGADAILARLWGGDRRALNGAIGADFEALQVVSAASGTSLSSEPQHIELAHAQRHWTSALAGSWTGAEPVLAGHAWIDGRATIFELPLVGDRTVPYARVAVEADVDDVAVVEDGDRTLLFWTESDAGAATRVKVSTAWGAEETLDVTPGPIAACAAGGSVVLASGPEVVRLDRGLSVRATTALPPGPIELSCEGSAAWALAPDRLVHIAPDGTVDFTDDDLPDTPRFVPASEGVWLRGGDVESGAFVLRRYGCEP